MAQESSNGKIRVHIWLDLEDVDEIDRLYSSSMGRSAAIRIIIKKYLNLIRAKVEEKAKPVGGVSVEL